MVTGQGSAFRHWQMKNLVGIHAAPLSSIQIIAAESSLLIIMGIVYFILNIFII